MIPLRNLSPAEARRYLEGLGVPADRHEPVLDFTHGHPLALALVADLFRQNPQLKFTPEAAPDVIQVLLGRFLAEVPSSAHRCAVEAAALVRAPTEPLLAAMLGLAEAEAGEFFDWLRGCSFIEAGPTAFIPTTWFGRSLPLRSIYHKTGTRSRHELILPALRFEESP